MKLEVTEYIEHDDGSATMHVEMDDTAKRIMIAEGLVAVLKRSLQYLEDNFKFEEIDAGNSDNS
jgi:ribosome biogenesis SPOUT family RNA methylase Rps3